MSSALMEKLKAEAKRVKEKAEGAFGPKIDWFQPEAGETMIRVLPHWKDPEEIFFKRILTHWLTLPKNDGSGTVQVPARCLQDFEETCPMCKAYEKIVRSGDKDAKEKARGLRPQEKYLYNIINYKERKVQPYAAPTTVHGGIMEWVEELGTDISDPDQGRDWKLIKKQDPRKPKGLGTSYAVRPSMKDTAIPEKLRPLLDNMINLDTLYKENRKADMLKMLGEVVADEEELEAEFAEDEEEETPKASKSAEKVKAAKAKTKPKDEEEEEDEPEFAEEDQPKKKKAKILEEGEAEEEEEDVPIEPKKKVEKKPEPAKKAKAKPKDEEEDEEGADVEVEDDDDLESELKDLGVLD